MWILSQNHNQTILNTTSASTILLDRQSQFLILFANFYNMQLAKKVTMTHYIEQCIFEDLSKCYFRGIRYSSFCPTFSHAPIPLFSPRSPFFPPLLGNSVISLTRISFGAIGGQIIATYSPGFPALSRCAFCIFSFSNPFKTSFSFTCSKKSFFPCNIM